MIVFRNYFKIARSYIPIIIIYTFIFTFIAIMASTSNNNDINFTTSKPNISIINNDKESILIETLKDYLEENTNIIEIETTEESIKDALFYRKVDYILIIPEYFTENFINGLKPIIEIMRVPDSYNSTYINMLLNRFLNITDIYVQAGMSEHQISNNIKLDLNNITDVVLVGENKTGQIYNANYFYNFSNYTLLALCVSIVGLIMSSFTDFNIKKRNSVSSFSYRKINKSLFFGNLCIMTLIWLIYVIISVILYGKVMFTNAGLLLILNSFIFSIAALSIGFFVGMLMKSKEAINGIINVLALGSSFISGAFVPQQFLGPVVLGIAKFFPSYWFVKNNNDISDLTIFNIETLGPVFLNMGIVLLFGLGFFILTNVISKIKLKT